MVPDHVPRHQVRRVRRCHLDTCQRSRASSRSSAPNDFTTALAPTASASTPPMRVSQAFDTEAAGAVQRVARVTVSVT